MGPESKNDIPSKRWHCRSRKRYIKLMMSEGISRNYAERLADFTRTLMPYGEAWRNYLLQKPWQARLEHILHESYKIQEVQNGTKAD